MLALKLLGTMALTQKGVDVPLPASKKTRALLGYLAVNDRAVRRERLCTMFWEVPDDPRGALRWSLSKLRALVDHGGDCRLIADRDGVRLNCDSMAVDWRALKLLSAEDIRTVDTQALIRATDLHGEFLEALELPSCEEYHGWLIAMREDVRRWQAALYRELVRRPIEPERALALARAWAVLDPYDALARVALIELLENTGRRQEADQQRAISIRKLGEGDVPVPSSLRAASTHVQAGPVESQPLPPQHIRFCTASDGTGLAYSIVGDGPPLIKAANWLNHLDFDWDSPVWRHWLHALTQERCLVRYDERGNGLSDWNSPDISFEAFVDDLSSVVDAVGVDQFDLLGISQGCSVSIAYAVRNPGRVRRMILFGGYAAGWGMRALPGEIERRQAMMTLTREGWGQNNPAFRQLFSMLFFPDASHGEIEWFNELQRITTSPENAVRLQRAFADIDVRSLLSQVNVPTMVLHAREDAVIPFSEGRKLAAGIAGAEFVTLESRNHLLLEDEPAWKRALECIRTFLS